MGNGVSPGVGSISSSDVGFSIIEVGSRLDESGDGVLWRDDLRKRALDVDLVFLTDIIEQALYDAICYQWGYKRGQIWMDP